MKTEPIVDEAIKESEDEAMSRRLLEEVQRTFIHLEEGSKGRCFDPKALVEAWNSMRGNKMTRPSLQRSFSITPRSL